MALFTESAVVDFFVPAYPPRKGGVMKKQGITIRFEQSIEQTVGEITKVIGLVKPRYLIQIINYLNLEANPRGSKTGPVTSAIQESLNYDKELFPFKTKGILLASSEYERLDRNRYRIAPDNIEIEGILDGGHNTLAIGLYLLEKALEREELSLPRGKKSWDDFKTLWDQHSSLLESYCNYIKENEDSIDDLDFFIPVELLIPRDSKDSDSQKTFNSNLLEICAARNNNVQLPVSDKANQHGYFDALKNLLEKKNPALFSRIEWKSNDGGSVNVQDLVALAWIPLSLLNPVKDEKGQFIKPPAPTTLYSGKSSALKNFEKLMGSNEVTLVTDADYKRELRNPGVARALEIAAELPELYDYIYEKFPSLYNTAGGTYGRINAVKSLNEKRKIKSAPFSGKEVHYVSPEGFITPLVYGLHALMECVEDDGYMVVKWITDPKEFLEKNLGKIVERYADIFGPWNYDPQKVGKALSSYKQSVDYYKMALAGIL